MGKVSLFGNPKKNAVVHLVDIKRPTPPSKKHAVMTQKSQLFLPGVLAVLKGTTVDFPNQDTVFHNAFSMSQGNSFDFGTYGPGKKPSVVFNSPGKADIFCNMHEQMHAVVLILEHPYFTLSSKKGLYEITDIPDGTYRIRAWINASKTEEKQVTLTSANPVRVDFDMSNGD